METVKRTVDELNQLAKKMTGTNPKAKTDAQALNFIEQNYTSGGNSKVKYATMNESMELNCTPNDVEQWLEETNNELQIIVKSIQNGTVSFVPINTIMENTLVAMVGSTTNQFVADGKDKNYKYVQI